MAGYEHDRIKALLAELDPKRFETLCFALLEAQGHTSVQHLGAGGGDRGIDLLSTAPNGLRWATQCKRSQKGPPDKARLLKDLGDAINAPPDPPPAVFHVATNAAITATIKEALQKKARLAGFPLELAFWDGTKVVRLLLDHPKIRKEYLPEVPGSGPFWNVPNCLDYFVGRKHILSILEARLESAGAAALTQAITGLGGVGKTQTAVEYCHRHRGRYEAGVFWVDGSTADALLAGYAGLAVALDLVGREVPVDDGAAAFLRHLAGRQGWLVVIDNADNPKSVRALLPPNTGGHVLVTTRERRPGLGRGEPLEVDLLPEKEATDFLLARGHRGDDERSAASSLAQALGRLPLALEQAGAYLAHQEIETTAYLASFEQRHLDLVEEYSPEQGAYGATVATTWEMSLQKVAETSPAAVEALAACGFVAPDGIPLELLTSTGDRLGPALGRLAASEDALALQRELIEPVTRYSLARFDAAEGGQFSVHRLVQAVIRRRHQMTGGLPRDEVEEADVFARVHGALESCFPEDPRSPASWACASRWLPHVQAGRALWSSGDSVSWDPTGLWVQGGLYAWAAGRSAEARALFESALEVGRRVLGEEHPDTLGSMNNLALTLSAQGDSAGARALFESALEVGRRVQGEEHPDTLMSMNNLALTPQCPG